MSRKDHRSGGKFSGSHTTAINAACVMADIANRQPEVTKISLGYIRANTGSANGQRHVKIISRDGNILLSIQENKTHQELVVYTNCIPTSLLSIARGARNEGFHISFGKK